MLGPKLELNQKPNAIFEIIDQNILISILRSIPVKIPKLVILSSFPFTRKNFTPLKKNWNLPLRDPGFVPCWFDFTFKNILCRKFIVFSPPVLIWADMDFPFRYIYHWSTDRCIVMGMSYHKLTSARDPFQFRPGRCICFRNIPNSPCTAFHSSFRRCTSHIIEQTVNADQIIGELVLGTLKNVSASHQCCCIPTFQTLIWSKSTKLIWRVKQD